MQRADLLVQRSSRRTWAFGEWVQVFGHETLTTALLDRLTHHADDARTLGSHSKACMQGLN
jgi:DNA replication protein DnaC